MGKVYRVYRIDQQTEARIPIGTIQERRNRSRNASNITGLMKLAGQVYSMSPEDQARIILEEEVFA
ncbi:MAG: hypothetical protein AB1346_14290 [Thermodesulfobacteriota bacterium]